MSLLFYSKFSNDTCNLSDSRTERLFSYSLFPTMIVLDCYHLAFFELKVNRYILSHLSSVLVLFLS